MMRIVMRMKRTILLAMACLMALAPAPAGAEAPEARVTVRIAYEGAWVPIAAYAFRLYLPVDWAIVQGGGSDALLWVLQPEHSYSMSIEAYDNSAGFTMDDLLEGFLGTPGFDAVQALYINDLAFVHYRNQASAVRGFITLSADASAILFFKFEPEGDAALTHLAEQIMSSLSPLAEGAAP